MNQSSELVHVERRAEENWRITLTSLLKDWKDQGLFLDWNEKQIRILISQLGKNLQGDLLKINQDDVLAVAGRDLFGDITYRYCRHIVSITDQEIKILLDGSGVVFNRSNGLRYETGKRIQWGWLVRVPPNTDMSLEAETQQIPDSMIDVQ